MNKLVQVKGITYSLSELIGDSKVAYQYEGGTCLVLRLCPTDYHRFHFIDNGIPKESHFIDGSYYSVNPTALERIPKLYCQNKREWSIFESENFGDIIHMNLVKRSLKVKKKDILNLVVQQQYYSSKRI